MSNNPDENKEDILSALRMLQAQAENGELTGMSFACSYNDGDVMYGNVGEHDLRPATALGVVTLLQSRLLDEFVAAGHTRPMIL